MGKYLIIAAVVLLVIVGGWIVIFSARQSSTEVKVSTPTQVPTGAAIEKEEGVMEKGEDATEEEGAMVEKTSVEIKNFAFGPKTLTVKKGTSVTFKNQDSVAHTATADDGSFDTGLLAKGESGSIAFAKGGMYTYHCTPHPYMKATIIVE